MSIELPTVITLQQSKTTKESEIIEKVLVKQLKSLMAIVGRDKDFPTNIAGLQLSYGRQVYSKLRKAIQEQYLIGMDYVEMSFGIEAFVSGKDEFNISRATEKAVDRFWRYVQIAAENVMKVQFEEAYGQEEGIVPFNLNYLWLILSTSLSVETLFNATVSKALEFIQANNIDQTRVKFKWIAQFDEKTCKKLPNGRPGCVFLNGMSWTVGQIAEIPTPGGLGLSPTHYNCRCRVVLIIDGEEKLL